MYIRYRPLRNEYKIYFGEIKSLPKAMTEFGLHLVGKVSQLRVSDMIRNLF